MAFRTYNQGHQIPHADLCLTYKPKIFLWKYRARLAS